MMMTADFYHLFLFRYAKSFSLKLEQKEIDKIGEFYNYMIGGREVSGLLNSMLWGECCFLLEEKYALLEDKKLIHLLIRINYGKNRSNDKSVRSHQSKKVIKKRSKEIHDNYGKDFEIPLLGPNPLKSWGFVTRL